MVLEYSVATEYIFDLHTKVFQDDSGGGRWRVDSDDLADWNGVAQNGPHY